MALEKIIQINERLKKIELPIKANDERIKPHVFYLAKIDVRDYNKNRKLIRGFIGWYAGTFSKLSSGWDFNGVGLYTGQYGCPPWIELYEIEDKETTEFWKEVENRMKK